MAFTALCRVLFTAVFLGRFFPSHPSFYTQKSNRSNPNDCFFYLGGNDGAGDGNRTHVTSLEGWGSTIELHPPNDGLGIRHKHPKWSGRRDSGSRHPPWQGGTLPLSYYRMLHLKGWCGRRDSNSYAFRHQILSLARLPFRHARKDHTALPKGKMVTHRRFELRTP